MDAPFELAAAGVLLITLLAAGGVAREKPFFLQRQHGLYRRRPYRRRP